MHGLPFGVDSSQTTINPLRTIQQLSWRELNQDLRRLKLERQAEVVLLVVNPEVLHVYWHVDSTRVLSLRLHDLAALDVSGSDPHHCFDWRILRPTGKAYLRLPGGNRHVMAEIGELQAYRRLTPLLSSKSVHLPVSPHRGHEHVGVISGDLVELTANRWSDQLDPAVAPASTSSPTTPSPWLASSPLSAYG